MMCSLTAAASHLAPQQITNALTAMAEPIVFALYLMAIGLFFGCVVVLYVSACCMPVKRTPHNCNGRPDRLGPLPDGDGRWHSCSTSDLSLCSTRLLIACETRASYNYSKFPPTSILL
ncbi:Hypothetical predicted protein [Cloeon dipterum]|uniref:Uncharacterized protein n=1 Tax=Cloeon dipterum TaxID=197152 RepID=A0A8S1DJ06_9INSE|nr:Hypothetical predicted protein [Cloeon dipterum]